MHRFPKGSTCISAWYGACAGVITPQPSLWLPAAASMRATSPPQPGAAAAAAPAVDAVAAREHQPPHAERVLHRECSQRSCVTTGAQVRVVQASAGHVDAPPSRAQAPDRLLESVQQAEGQTAPDASGDGAPPGAPAAGARSGNLVRPVPRNPEEVVAGILGAIRQQRAALAHSRRQQLEQQPAAGGDDALRVKCESSFTPQASNGSSAAAQQVRPPCASKPTHACSLWLTEKTGISGRPRSCSSG